EDLKWNIDRTRCKDRATLINTDAFEYVVKSKEKFDIIFVAPPQWVGMCQKAMDSLSARTDLLEDDGIIITQHNPAEEVVVDDKIFTEYDKRIYGGVQFNFYRKSRN
ncbi:MAG TPA: RsmD family RNA methyltransferase, partial [Candidatus Ornithoclostridium faecavium]|nr:RsmD family RNA methyltransferase [Candidatus Ornithoclostridium faecavium]